MTLAVFAFVELTPLRIADSPTSQGTQKPAASSQESLPTVASEETLSSKPIAPGASWRGEAFTEFAMKQLKLLAAAMSARQLDLARLKKLTDDTVQCQRLRPESLGEVYRDTNSDLIVHRPTNDSVHQNSRATLSSALTELLAPFGSSDRSVSFKIIRVEVSGASVDTLVQYQAATAESPDTVDNRLQQNAMWQVGWTWSDSSSPPRIQKIALDAGSFEEVSSQKKTLFTDCTASALQLASSPDLRRQLLTGQTYWTKRLEADLGVDIGAFHGLGLGDVNGDGLSDLYLCMPGGLPNRLLIQNTDGTVTDRASDYGVEFLDFTRHALLVDLDNDGDQDLALLASGSLMVLENDANRFTRISTHSFSSSVYSISAADIDNDGLLDLHVTGRDSLGTNPSGRSLLGDPVPYHDAVNGGSDAMLRNLGKLQFEDVTRAVGLVDVRFSQAAAWEDYDNDGDLDLYVANDFGRNALYRNDHGHFTNVAAEAGVEDLAAGMSVSWADYNRDGYMDLYVSNMFSSAGNRVAYQRQFQHTAAQTARAQFQRHARGNTLFQNLGDGTFRDVSVEAGVTMGRWAWSSTFCDLNNDGLEDILVANGFVTNDETEDL